MLATILGERRPVLAIAVTELGKLLAVDEPSPRTPDMPDLSGPSFEAQVREEDAFSWIWGGQVGREVGEIIVALEKEIGVFKRGMRNALEVTGPKERG
ncbi:hypothetical protein GYMLUDRAFT_240603 [Collybiopsis luxurians FD-317 M1]|nr:hypothetical protein GYMLUDRAFT_240603 [Collybiopsis luxurians FD-317 M1]